MKIRRCLSISLALALAAVLLLAGSVLAQNRKGGGPAVCPVGQGNQLCTGGPGGTGVVNPTNDPANQNSPRYGAGNSQRRMGKGRAGGRANQPNTPANPPVTSQ